MRLSSAAAPARPSTTTSQSFAPQPQAPPSPPAARTNAQRAPSKAGAATNPGSSGKPDSAARPAAEQKILFQKFFKSVGPRTYAAQVKEANNGNHFIVLTEGKRDNATGEVRKTRLFVFSEDFAEFFDLLEQTARFIKAHPVPKEVEQRRRRFWAKKTSEPAPASASR